MASTDALIVANRRKYEGSVEEIRSNADWNEDAKKRMIDGVYRVARERHAELAEKAQTEAREGMERARREAFAPPRIPNADPALVHMSYRAALEKVKETIEPRLLEETLEQAVLVGDKVLAKAILLRAYQLRHEGLVGAYLKAYPDEVKVWDRFSERAAEYNEVERTTRLFGTLGPRSPAEMGA